MIRVRTKNRRPRFFRGGIEFGREWLTLTEPGDTDSPQLTADQAAIIRAEKRFLEVEEIDAKKASKTAGKKPSDSKGSSGRVDDPVPKGTGETSTKNTHSGGGDDPSGNAPAGGEPDKSKAGPSDPAGDGAKPKGKGPAVVNVNTASAAAIAKAAAGIGPATAKDLVKHRKTKPFQSLDDLTVVGGISQAIVDQNRDVLTV